MSKLEAMKWLGSIMGEREFKLMLGERERMQWGRTVAQSLVLYWEVEQVYDNATDHMKPAYFFIVEDGSHYYFKGRFKTLAEADECYQRLFREHAIEMASRVLGVDDDER